MWSCFGDRVTIHAAIFWIRCSLLSLVPGKQYSSKLQWTNQDATRVNEWCCCRVSEVRWNGPNVTQMEVCSPADRADMDDHFLIIVKHSSKISTRRWWFYGRLPNWYFHACRCFRIGPGEVMTKNFFFSSSIFNLFLIIQALNSDTQFMMDFMAASRGLKIKLTVYLYISIST